MNTGLFSSGENTKKTTKNLSWLPRNDHDVLTVCLRVMKHGLEYVPPLKWITTEEFANETTHYDNLLNNSYMGKAERGLITHNYNDLISLVLKGYTHVNDYMKEHAPETYDLELQKLGAVKENGRLIFPTDKSTVREALERMVDNIGNYAFAGYMHGKEFWQQVYDNYLALADESATKDTDNTRYVAEKNDLKADLQKVLKSILNIIRAQYPDNPEAKFREAGFEKKY